jgi:two-component system NtrC family response regulator
MPSHSGKSRARVLVAEDDATTRLFVEAALNKAGLDVVSLESGEQALERLAGDRFDLVLADIRMPGMSGLELLSHLRSSAPDLPVMLMTAHGSVEAAVEAMRQGATDYVTKPLDPDDLEHRVNKALSYKRLEVENRWLHDELAASFRPGRIVGVSRAMREVVQTIEKMAQSDATVLLTGETGTGKELVARALHYGGPRAGGPFVAVNCAALPANLVESELFGHVKGAFTGAHRDHPGKLEAAHKGTLLLDEVGDLPPDIQPKLLRAIQERASERVGSHKPRRVDVRFVAATNRNLEELVEQGRFREDLYYRLAVVPIHVPPLRDRPEDIGPLARHLVLQMTGGEAPELTEGAVTALSKRAWRGNVRELANVLERTLALHDEGPVIADELPPEGSGARAAPAPSAPQTAEAGAYLVALPAEGAPLDDMVRDLIVQALEAKNWNQSAAARFLRIPRHVLQYRLAKFGITPPENKP